MTFDFASYLETKPPAVKYDVERLDEGIVNHTVRAKARSLILKHAPPYVAGVGPDLPFSQERQKVEATALRLFQANGPLASILTSTPECPCPITIPTVVAHDTEASILMLEDLGPLGTLWNFLSDSSCADGPSDESDSFDDAYWDIGTRIGSFFAALHSQETLARLTADENASQFLSHSLTDGLIYEAAVTPLLDRMKKYGIKNAEGLHQRVVDAFKAPPNLERFCLGDCHPGSFLIDTWTDRPHHVEEDLDRKIAVIDWEFAHIRGQGVDGDMAQLLANLYCHLTASNVDSTRWMATYSLMQGLSNGYGKAADFNRQEFVENQDGWQRRLALLRSTMILYGREIINQVFDREEAWAATEGTLTEMVAEGAFYIDMAGKDPEAIVQNWATLKEHDFFLLNLFGWGKQESDEWEYLPPPPV